MILEDYSDEFLLRTIQDRGVKLRPCSFICGLDDSDTILGHICQKYGIYTEGEFPSDGSRESYPICYCPKHRALLESGDYRGWCTQRILLPDGDVARCQHTGVFSWSHKRYLCDEHKEPTESKFPRVT